MSLLKAYEVIKASTAKYILESCCWYASIHIVYMHSQIALKHAADVERLVCQLKENSTK